MVKLSLILVVVLSVILKAHVCAADTTPETPIPESKEYGDVIITTALGKVRGTYMTSSTGRIFYAFRGIRYAKPPVGDLRFKPPQPNDQWNGIFDATKDGPMCPQPTEDLADISEDCLRINIYSHALPTEQNGNVRKPVIVYLHPGGFYSNSGQSWNHAGPLYLMNRNIVLVTLNYRLGALGFLSTGTPEAPGNAGLKDQVMALKWIKLHIPRFGGDPNSVTLLGQGAGAVSITLHMISPMSKNLFHKAIVMSGAATGHNTAVPHQMDLTKKQARLLNCTDHHIREMMDCLMTKDAMEFGTSLGEMIESESSNGLYKTVIEPDFGQERFVVDDPIKLYQTGRFMRIPVIAGITKDEFAGPAIWSLRNSSRRNELDRDFEEWAPAQFLYSHDTKRSRQISTKLRDFYLGDGPISLNRTLDGLVKLYSDSIIGFPMHQFVRLAARHTLVYQYRFAYQGRYSHIYYPEDDTPYGVVHHDDLLYLFTGPFIAPVFKDDDPEVTTMERLTRMWASFAYRGDPNKPQDEYLRNYLWRPFGFRRQPYLDIGEDLVMKRRLYSDRYDIWEELFPLKWPSRRRGRMANATDNVYDDFPELNESIAGNI